MRQRDIPVQGGPRKRPVSVGLGFIGDSFSYCIDLGLPPPPPPQTAFSLDPEIKGEYIWNGAIPRPAAMLVERRGGMVRNRSESGEWLVVSTKMAAYDSMLSQLSDPRRMPEVSALRQEIRSWRFYDHFRTDAEAPARLPQIGTHTPILNHDGSDLAAALQTIREIGDEEALDQAIDDAFPGSRISVQAHDGRFEISMKQEGLLRPLRAMEFSDGTLRYLLWVAALLSPRSPELLVLNEPETSLHPDLLGPLGRLISRAARSSQVIVVSHASRLISSLEVAGCNSIHLAKELGETMILGQDFDNRPSWRWIDR